MFFFFNVIAKISRIILKQILLFVFQVFGVVSLMFVVLSILGFCLETLPDLRPVNVTLDMNTTKHHCDGQNVTANTILVPNEGLTLLDMICTIYFTLELIVRFIFSPNKISFVLSAMNFIDLLALVPLYMQLILNTDAFKYCYANKGYIFEIMFILRIVRMFRIFHLVKHYQALQILLYALKASIQELFMLLIFLLIGMLVFATMIYYAEREDAFNQGSQFSTIPLGFWWAIITMTTVGYGDIAPSTPLGYIVGTCCAVSGVLMVALTIPVISNNFTLFYTHVRSRRRGSARSISSTIDGEDDDDMDNIESKLYINTWRTSNGSLILNDQRIFKKRRESNISTVTADLRSRSRCARGGRNGVICSGTDRLTCQSMMTMGSAGLTGSKNGSRPIVNERDRCQSEDILNTGRFRTSAFCIRLLEKYIVTFENIIESKISIV